MNANIRALDLNLLVAFDALYEERSVTRAADKLALSQPAVSGILNRLRDIFGDELFLRTSHGMLPTSRADTLAGQVKHVIRSTQSLFEQEHFDPGTDAFDIALCGTDYVSRTLFSSLIPELVRLAPRANLTVTQLQSGTSSHRDMLDHVDVIFTSHDPMLPHPEGMFLFGDDMVCVSSYREHINGQHVPLPELCRLSHIIGQRALRSTVSESLSNALREKGLSRKIALEVPDFASVFRLMETCELVAFLPGKLASRSGVDLKRLRVDLDIPAAQVFARWHPRLEGDPRHVWLRERIKDVANKLSNENQRLQVTDRL